MAYQLDAKFFRKAKRVNRAIEITETQAVIPAVKDSPEIRVSLPNRRPKTMEERKEVLDARYEELAALEEEVEVERRKLMDLTKVFRETGTGGAEVIVQNMKIDTLMGRRRGLRYPEIWIEEIPGLTLVDVFASKRDTRSMGANVYQVKTRVEPIESLYVDLGGLAAAANVSAEEEEDSAAAATVVEEKKTVKPLTAEERAKGATIGSAKKAFKLKSSGAGAP
jgi:hypothetical protein